MKTIKNAEYASKDDTSQYIVDLSDYRKIKSGIIGSGSYGTIFLVENIHNHKKYATKVKIKYSKNYEDLKQEIKFYTSIKFPTILSLHGYSMTNFENKSNPTLIFEYMPNNYLADLLKNPHKFIQSIISKKYIIMWGIIWAMMYLHKRGTVHRDLKPSNILLDENYYPRVSDFESSIMYNEIDQLKKKYEKNTLIKQLIESNNQYDQQKANFYLKKSADSGYNQAMIEYGNRLLKGLGTNANQEEASRYYKMAADKGSPEGMINYERK